MVRITLALLVAAAAFSLSISTLSARADDEKPASIAKDSKKNSDDEQDDDEKLSRHAHALLAVEHGHESADHAENKDEATDKPGSHDAVVKHGDDKADESKESSAEKKAGEDKKPGDKKEPADKKDDEPKPSITHHKTEIDGQEIAYTATAGKMLMKTDEGDPKAHVFYVAYTKKKVKNRADRPITFCFNGGPGSSSVWLHLGMLGPRRVKLDSDAKTLPPPHEIIDNPYSLLDVTDLVFIDPVSTGYSRPAKGEKAQQFHGYDEDIRSVGQFIHNYTVKSGRWGSPKFLIGESYGGLRAAGLSGELQDRYHLYLNGIVLVSSVVDFQTLMTYGNNDIAYALFLPSYAATAWYHKALSDDMQQKSVEDVVAAAEKFAAGPYLHGLAAGDSLSKEDRQELVARMSRLTGLSKDYIERSNLRVPMQRFGKELLRDRKQLVGRFDSRYVGISNDLVGDSEEYDPSASAVFGTFTSAMNDYLRTSLQGKEDQENEIRSSDPVQPWDYGQFTNRFVDASATLQQAMTENPYLKVYAACGYYDLATPELAMKYTRDHLQLSPELRDNFQMGFYKAGHMMYANEPSLKKLRQDLLKFYDSALPKQEERGKYRDRLPGDRQAASSPNFRRPHARSIVGRHPKALAKHRCASSALPSASSCFPARYQ